MARLLWLPLLFLLSILLYACDGGDGTTPMPITITGVTQNPAGPQPEGTTVVFTVTATGGSPPYSSVFSLPGGGGTILSQGVMSATVLLGSAGTYQGQVVVSDGTETANTNFPFEVDPLIPVVTGVTPTGAAGLPLGEVEFEAAIDGAYDTVTWDFGAGAEILSQTGNTARVRLLNPGNYTVRVFAENSNGRGDPLEFGYVVELPVEPPWNILEFGEASEVGFPGTSMVLADDRLAVAFNSGSGLKLLRALVENPMGPADFTETVIDPDGAINGAHSLASRSNELYVVYYKFNAGTGEYDSLWFARALTGNPTGPADWVRYQLAAPAYMTGYGEALAAFEEGVVWGSAATTPSSPGKAVLVVSWLADPGSSTGIGDWSQHEVAIPDASVAGACEFRLVEGTLYALMTKFSSENTGGIWLARSLSYPPEGPEDWEPFPIDNQGEFGLAQGATAIINGRFAVLYQRGSSVSRAGWIGLAGDNHPGESSIWTRKALPTDDTANTFGATVAISGGRAAIAYTADADFFSPRPTRGDLVLLRQTGADPADGSAATWVRTVVDAEGATGYQAIIGTLADGRLAIAYANLTSGRFRLAIAQGPY